MFDSDDVFLSSNIANKEPPGFQTLGWLLACDQWCCTYCRSQLIQIYNFAQNVTIILNIFSVKNLIILIEWTVIAYIYSAYFLRRISAVGKRRLQRFTMYSL